MFSHPEMARGKLVPPLPRWHLARALWKSPFGVCSEKEEVRPCLLLKKMSEI